MRRKNMTKKVKITLLIGLILCIFNAEIVMAASNIPYALDFFNRSNAQGTWHQDSIGWWFEYSGGGYPTNTWEQINDNWYYFNEDGYMLVGWQEIDNEWFFYRIHLLHKSRLEQWYQDGRK